MEATFTATTTSISKDEANKIVDSFASSLIRLLGMRANALIEAMDIRLKHDQKELTRLETELTALSSGYHKYLDTMEHIRAHERSIEKLKAIVGYGAAPYGVLAYTQPESSDDLQEEKASKELRRNLELWEVMEQYLRFVAEVRVKEILEFMQAVGIRASRQSIEAAIKAHPKVFRIEKKKREKYVSLK